VLGRAVRHPSPDFRHLIRTARGSALTRRDRCHDRDAPENGGCPSPVKESELARRATIANVLRQYDLAVMSNPLHCINLLKLHRAGARVMESDRALFDAFEINIELGLSNPDAKAWVEAHIEKVNETPGLALGGIRRHGKTSLSLIAASQTPRKVTTRPIVQPATGTIAVKCSAYLPLRTRLAFSSIVER
jgi:hypothetical protein